MHQIQGEKRTTISEVIVHGKREILLSKINKIGIGFISIFLLKAQVSYLTILKVCNLFSFTRVSFCQNCILPSDSEANRDGADPEFPFPLFFAFSDLTLTHEKRSENCLRFATTVVGRVSVCIHYCSEI